MILTFKIKKRFSAAIIGLNADVKINAFLIWMKNYIENNCTVTLNQVVVKLRNGLNINFLTPSNL